MEKVSNIKKYTPIDLKLGIKSSMPKVKSTISLLLLMVLSNENCYSIDYSTEINDSIEISDVEFKKILNKLSILGDDIKIDENDFKNIINENQIFKSQIEALIVTFELCYELARFTFLDQDKTFSSERSGGKRYNKTVSFTTNIDYFIIFAKNNEKDVLCILLNWLGLDFQVNKELEESLIRLLTLFSEKALFKLSHQNEDVIFNNLSMYESVLKHDQVDISSEVEPKGSLRILYSLLNEGLNYFLQYNKNQNKVSLKPPKEKEVLLSYSKRLERYFEVENKKDSLKQMDSISEDTIKGNGQNILLYGVPGSGKSHKIATEYCNDESRMERLVFHPDYMNTDFVGQILPIVKENGDITYSFVPGPFTRILKKAIDNPTEHFYLIVEELNRGNAPGIFGEIFQLLDRDENGTSVYGINNSVIAEEVYGDKTKQIRIPSNLSLLATMNTADQNVFTLDTAFQRRWIMEMIENDVEASDYAGYFIADSQYTWSIFNSVVNNQILETSNQTLSSEDKRMGAYFISSKILNKEYIQELPSDDELLNEFNEKNKRFAEKVLKYLWDDAFKFNRGTLFNINEFASLEAIIKHFTDNQNSGKQRFAIFTNDIIDKFDLKLPKQP